MILRGWPASSKALLKSLLWSSFILYIDIFNSKGGDWSPNLPPPPGPNLVLPHKHEPSINLSACVSIFEQPEILTRKNRRTLWLISIACFHIRFLLNNLYMSSLWAVRIQRRKDKKIRMALVLNSHESYLKLKITVFKLRLDNWIQNPIQKRVFIWTSLEFKCNIPLSHKTPIITRHFRHF